MAYPVERPARGEPGSPHHAGGSDPAAAGAPRWVVDRLAAAGCVAAEEEAAELAGAACPPGELREWVRRREDGEPLAWIVGSLGFCGARVRVSPGVYVPRHQTEVLAEVAASLLADQPGPAIDLCTGCGAVAAHLARAVPTATVVGVDRDVRAAADARRNGVLVVRADLEVPIADGAAGVVTAVCPYVPTGELAFLPADVTRWEPRSALNGGPDGLVSVRRACAAAARLLRPGGWLVLELGGTQDRLLGPELARHFEPARTWVDEDGDLRGLVARRRV